MGHSSPYLSRIFSGDMQLRFEHIVLIAKALGLSTAEFFCLAYPRTGQPPSKALSRLLSTLGKLDPPAPPPPVEEPLEERMEKTLRRFFGEMARIGREEGD